MSDNHKLQSQIVAHLAQLWQPPPHAKLEMYFAPGRVNLIGEHLDYNGGPVLPICISRGVYAAVWVHPQTPFFRVASLNEAQSFSFAISEIANAKPTHTWADYPLGVAQQMALQGIALTGCSIVLGSDLAVGAGLSSSAALSVLVSFILLSLGGLPAPQNPLLHQMAQQAENKFVGVNCGVMDPYCIAMGQADYALLINCQVPSHQYVQLKPEPYQWVVLNTNASRRLAEGVYNSRRAKCEEALQIMQSQKPALTHLAAATPQMLATLGAHPQLLTVARHVVTETERVQQAVLAAQHQNWAQLGLCLNASHASLQRDYEVTGPFLDAIVAGAQAHPACLGARMTGAGFGGCAIALVEGKQLDEFAQGVTEQYYTQTGLVAEIFSVTAAGGAKKL